MRIIHTSDWHLGQTFYEYDRKMEHLQFLEWLKMQIQMQQIDVLLIAGDIFDSPNPSAESQRMFYAFLRQVTMLRPGLQVVVIAGNHDSAARLEAPDPLLEEMNIKVRGVIWRDAAGGIDYGRLVLPLYEGERVVAKCLAVPYLRQGDYPEATSYAEGVKMMYHRLVEEAKEEGIALIAMGHLQATGSEISENDRSERTIIGGLECVSPDSFTPEIIYTALGHLHRGQRVSGRENVRYAGSPIPMSFAEKNNRHGVVCVEINEHGSDISILTFAPPVELWSLLPEASILPEVLRAIEGLPQGVIRPDSPYLEIQVLITEPEPTLRYQIEEALRDKAVRLARIVAVTRQYERQGDEVCTYEQLQAIHPMEVAQDIFRKKYGGEDMPEPMKQLLQSVIRETE